MTQVPATHLRCVQCGHEGPSVAFQCHVDKADSEFEGEYHLSIRCADAEACEARLRAKAREQRP